MGAVGEASDQGKVVFRASVLCVNMHTRIRNIADNRGITFI